MDYWVHDKLKKLEAAFTPEYCQGIDRVVALIVESFQKGNTLLTCGNGGSASDSQHIAAEFIGRFLINRRGLPAIALSSNPATLTAWTNDHEFETVFSRQVESLGKPGDMLWGISTSGKSENVIRALKTAKQLGIVTIGMAGNDGGMFKDIIDYPLFISEQQTPVVQEIHVITYHRICEQVELQLFKDKG